MKNYFCSLHKANKKHPILRKRERKKREWENENDKK